MIGQQINVVAGDFNGTAWRCSNRDNISTIDEAFADSALPTPPGLTPLWGPGLTSVGSLNRPVQIGIGRYACMVRSPSHAKLSACVQPIKVAIMRHGSTWISSIGTIPNHITKQKISFKVGAQSNEWRCRKQNTSDSRCRTMAALAICRPLVFATSNADLSHCEANSALMQTPVTGWSGGLFVIPKVFFAVSSF